MAQSIQGYLHGLPAEHKRIANALMAVIRRAAPKAAAAVKWDQIVFEQEGPVCFIRSGSGGVVFGFWRGQELDSAKGRLEAGNKAEAHLLLTAEGDVRAVPFQAWVQEAVKLNRFRPLPPK